VSGGWTNTLLRLVRRSVDTRSVAAVAHDSSPPPDLLPVDEARRRIDALVVPVTPFERVALRSALDRVLAEPVVAAMAVPPHANSAMDGYAVRSADLPAAGGERALRLVGQSLAGVPYAGGVGPGECIRILTGAVVPTDTDTVIMQEVVRREGSTVRISHGAAAGDNVRLPGQDIAAGATVIEAGTRITPAHLGVIASVGGVEVTVRRRPRVAFFSTGDELRGAGELLGPGQIYDSNRYSLFGMLARLGVDALDLGVVRDHRDAVREAFIAAGEVADAVITTGGVSVGDTDYVKETIEALGTVDFWRIAMKPGKPLAVGRVGGALFFGLPGNPVSAMVTFYQLVQPALRRLAGEAQVTPLLVQARCTTELAKHPGRMEFQRGVLGRGADGRLEVTATGMQDSHVLSSMARANCFILLPAESAGVGVGEDVVVQPFEGLV
jgi:molybdopterin molybdotransferase